ncbi:MULTISPECIES: NUDIX hydrolase [Brevibacterium]|jgi:8-oxo-dGTP pyrophosphatase MutT (NUDIX family)|uniref:NUDIX domain-containing protein n=1 Tax=Brevibacterium casei TaxID=33889 RepID=A0A7T3ZY08_9MICO|nr:MULTISPECIES: NUDIX domain-containing protein [Brevibacterium]MCM1012569.1 NUDIX domain-containing protein [Brevibacterium sp. XM4083]QQB13743.1 NUDIX domain-containing protein [Brevibacterium casei]
MKPRKASRVVLLNERDEVLLIRAQDLLTPTHQWWMTVGGGSEMGESPAQTAARELAEETGLECEPGDLIGPLAIRDEVFHFTEKELRQLETYFAYRTSEDIELEDAVWTDIEKRSLLEFRWWSRDELMATTETIYPKNLLSLMELAAVGTVPDVPLVID